MQNLQSALGVAAIIAIAWLVSENRRAVPWRQVMTGLAVTFALALLMLPSGALVTIIAIGARPERRPPGLKEDALVQRTVVGREKIIQIGHHFVVLCVSGHQRVGRRSTQNRGAFCSPTRNLNLGC